MRLTAFKPSEQITRIYERRRSIPGAAPQPANPVASGGMNRGSILLEVPNSARDEGRHGRNDEERQAGDQGRVPDLWHGHVQDWQGEIALNDSRTRHEGRREPPPLRCEAELEPQSLKDTED